MWHNGKYMLQRIHTDALHFSTPVESYWEESADPLNLKLESMNGSHACDVAIIGAGFTGLSAALELASSGVDVVVLDAGPIGWGASGRNGGFACFGSHKLSYAKLLQKYGIDETRRYYGAMKDAIARVASNLDEFGIDAWKAGSGDLSLAHAPSRIADLKAEKEFLKQVTGDDAVLLSQDELRQQGHSGPQFFGGLIHPNGFGIHPLNYVRGLARAAHKAGAKLHQHSCMIRWEQNGGVHRIVTEHGTVTAKRVLVATNGYTPENISTHHAGRLLPALSSIMVTRPLSEAEKQEQGWTSNIMASDSRTLLHYFRLLPNNRFLFGGRGGTDSSVHGADVYRTHITAAFHRLFPAWRNVDITHYWRGFVCLSYDKVPYVGALDDGKSVWTSIAYHGNGVAMASHCGRAVARMMLGKAGKNELPAILTRRLAKFPVPAFRTLYLKGAYLWFGWKDAR